MRAPQPDITTIAGLQAAVDRWITTTGRGYFSPLTNTAILAEETGEVARIMARTRGDQVAKAGDITPGALADELADVIWVVAAIANQENVDLTLAINNNLNKKINRDATRFADRTLKQDNLKIQ